MALSWLNISLANRWLLSSAHAWLAVLGDLLANGIGPFMESGWHAILGELLEMYGGPIMYLDWLVIIGESLGSNIGPFVE